MILKLTKNVLLLACGLFSLNSYAFKSLNCTDGFRAVEMNSATKSAVFTGFGFYGIESDQNYSCLPQSEAQNPLAASVIYYSCTNANSAFTVSVVNSYGVVSLQLLSPAGLLLFNGGCITQ